MINRKSLRLVDAGLYTLSKALKKPLATEQSGRTGGKNTKLDFHTRYAELRRM